MMFGLFGSKVKPINIEFTLNILYQGLNDLEHSFDLILNDSIHQAQKILEENQKLGSNIDYPSDMNPLMSFGKAILAFQTSIMGFEESGFSLAAKELLFSESLATTWSTSILQVLKTTNTNSLSYHKLKKADLLLKLISADSLLMLSAVSFLSQSLSEYAKAAYRLKKAYDSFVLLDKAIGFELNDKELNNEPFSKKSEDPFDSFLISGVSFGLGLLKLMISSLPRKAKTLLNGVGFHIAERSEAINYLKNSILYKGLHGSLSSMLLLSFYSGWLSFVSHLPIANTREYQEAEQLIPKFRTIYPQGRIWILLECKIIKLKGDLNRVVELLEKALATNTDSWPELKYLILYEYAWCKILVGDYPKAATSYSELRAETNWSKAFYCYLEAICHLRTGENKKATQLFLEAPSLIRKRIGGRIIPIEAFVKSRSTFYNECINSNKMNNSINLIQCLPQLEVTYYFNGFHFMSNNQLNNILNELNQFNAPQPNNIILNDDINILSHLILGTIHRELNDSELAQQHLNHLINLPNNTTFQSTTLSYSHFELAVLQFNSPPSTPNPNSNEVKVNHHLQALNQYLFSSELEERLSYRLEWLKEDLPLSTTVTS